MKTFQFSTLRFAVLALIGEQERYGAEISKIIEQKTNGLKLNAGTLYPLIRQLERDELISSIKKSPPEGGAYRNYLSLTTQGESWLKNERKEMEEIVTFLESLLHEKKENIT